ncbi:MAG: aminoacetone oxidase family FAD-binding enzyme [bacterium]|nr:aminoacetone oxidase family FAD-binding enzyme [bacterium]
MIKTVIIGAGPSGITSAIFAQKKGEDVTIIEGCEKPLKKLLLTGSGRCNYLNEDFNIKHYHGKNIELFKSLFTKENKDRLLNFFDSIGIEPLIINGYYYPYSNTSYAMYEALLVEVNKRGIKLNLNEKLLDIALENNKFKLKTEKQVIICDKLIISTGSKSFPKTGSDGSIFPLLEKLGHKVEFIYPSLVKLKTEEVFQKKWDGVRSIVKVSLYENNRKIKEEVGQIQFSKDGISGICIFNLSGYVNKGLKDGKDEQIRIDFMPFLDIDPLVWIENKNKKLYKRSISELLEGFLNYKIIDIILNKSKIEKNSLLENLSQREKEMLIKNLTEFEVDIKVPSEVYGAQVCGGGISLNEIDPRNMESKLVKNLYLTGEVIDIWGDCGGFNLAFAFLTGILTGSDIND